MIIWRPVQSTGQGSRITGVIIVFSFRKNFGFLMFELLDTKMVSPEKKFQLQSLLGKQKQEVRRSQK